MPLERVCSFCRKPPNEVGPIIEGPSAGSGSVYICRACAVLAIDILDDEDRVRRGEKSTFVGKFTTEMIEVCTKALGQLEELSRQRELTEIELGSKQRLDAELEKLKSEP